MRLPVLFETTPATQLHHWASRQLTENGESIRPEIVEFVNDLYAAQPGSRLAVRALLESAAGILGEVAKSKIRVVQVFNGWHTSPSDGVNHLTIYFPMGKETCHVYADGTYNCFPPL